MRWRLLVSTMLGLILSVATLSSARAAALTDVTAQLTRQSVATPTDIGLAFSTPTGVDAGSDTMLITFPSGFDISALSSADFSLSYGPATGFEFATTVAAVADVDVWGWQRMGNVVTLVPPTNSAAGSIPAGNRIIVRIGIWAGGTNQVITPSLVGVYALHISGSFGDLGDGYVEIRASDALTVTATVPGSGGGGGAAGGVAGGGGLGGAPLTYDGTPPVISELRVERLTDTSAVVRWFTDESADAYLEYGRAANEYLLGAFTREDRRVLHAFELTGLTPETEYHLRVRARDVLTNTRWSPDVSFTTLASPIGLTITGVEVFYVDDHQAIIRWTTNIDTIGTVTLNTTTGERTFSETTAGRTHSVTITDLVASTFYPFRVRATPAVGASVVVDGAGFTTLSDRTPPSNVRNFRAVYVPVSATVDLTWVNPADPDFHKTQITRLSSSAPSGEVFVCITNETRCTDIPPAGLTSVTYRAVAHDVLNNTASGALATTLILSPTRPTIEPSVTEPELGTEPEGTTRPPAPRPAGGGDDNAVLLPILSPGPGSGSAGGSDRASGDGLSGSSSTDPFGREATSTDIGVDLGTGRGDEALQLTPEFFLSSTVLATPDRVGVRSALLNRSIQVRVPITGLSTSLHQVQLQTSGGSIYQFAYRESFGAFISDFAFDTTQGQNQFVQIQAVAADGRRWEGRFPFHVWPPARVLDVSDRSRSAPVSGATIEVIVPASGATIVRLTADESGRYSEVLANGLYRLRVMKEGFRGFEREVRIETGVLVQDIELRRNIRPLSEVLDPNASLGQNMAALGSEAVLAIQSGLEVAQRAEVQAATREVVAPIVVVATVGATATAVTGFNLINYLRFLFTQPLLLIRRRKRKSWGVVYNALSKQPIELAIVRLLKAGTSFALQTRITDAQGRFSFLVPPGSYTIQVQKPGYVYPTSYLKEERTDVDFVDLYHGEALKVTEQATISPNIPVDPVVKEETPKAIIRKRYWRKAQSALGIGGILVSFGAIVVSPTLPMIGFAVFQVVTYALFRRLAMPPAPKRWGIVYDTDGKKPLAKAIVRIFDKKFNKLLETQITTKDGTYGFFVSKGMYYLTAEKPGYERYLSSHLDLTQAKDTYIDHRFTLKRASTVLK